VWVIIGGNGNSVYNRLIGAMGRPDMGLENPRYATDAARVQHEAEIVEVRPLRCAALCCAALCCAVLCCASLR